MTKTTPKRKYPTTLLYTFIAILVLVLLGWSFNRSLQENDTRQVNVQVPGQGFVTLSLTTDPYPPLPSGTVQLSLMGMNSRGVVINLGPEIPFTFGPQGSESPQGSGIATSMGDGGYRAGVVFGVPGEYWLQFDLGDAGSARFQLRVEPAQ